MNVMDIYLAIMPTRGLDTTPSPLYGSIPIGDIMHFVLITLSLFIEFNESLVD